MQTPSELLFAEVTKLNALKQAGKEPDPDTLASVYKTLATVKLLNPQYAEIIDPLFDKMDTTKVKAKLPTAIPSFGGGGGSHSEMSDVERVRLFLGKIVPADQLKKGFDSVIGYTDVKMQMCTSIMAPLTYPSFNAKLDVKASGALLYGPGGTGKTQFVRALAYETKSPLFFITGSMITSKFVGEGPKNMKALLSAVEQTAKDPNNKGAILFIDEADQIFGGDDKSSVDIVNEFKSNFNPGLNVATLVATNDPKFFEDGAIARRLGGLSIYVGLPKTLTDAEITQGFSNAVTEVECGGGFKLFKNYVDDAFAITKFYLDELSKCEGAPGPEFTLTQWVGLLQRFPVLRRLTPDNLRSLVTRVQQTNPGGKAQFKALHYERIGQTSWRPITNPTTDSKTWDTMTEDERGNICWPGVTPEDLLQFLSRSGFTPTTTVATLRKFLKYAQGIPEEKAVKRITEDLDKFKEEPTLTPATAPEPTPEAEPEKKPGFWQVLAGIGGGEQ